MSRTFPLIKVCSFLCCDHGWSRWTLRVVLSRSKIGIENLKNARQRGGARAGWAKADDEGVLPTTVRSCA